jgi:hypothetical protein
MATPRTASSESLFAASSRPGSRTPGCSTPRRRPPGTNSKTGGTAGTEGHRQVRRAPRRVHLRPLQPGLPWRAGQRGDRCLRAEVRGRGWRQALRPAPAKPAARHAWPGSSRLWARRRKLCRRSRVRSELLGPVTFELGQPLVVNRTGRDVGGLGKRPAARESKRSPPKPVERQRRPVDRAETETERDYWLENELRRNDW